MPIVDKLPVLLRQDPEAEAARAGDRSEAGMLLSFKNRAVFNTTMLRSLGIITILLLDSDQAFKEEVWGDK